MRIRILGRALSEGFVRLQKEFSEYLLMAVLRFLIKKRTCFVQISGDVEEGSGLGAVIALSVGRLTVRKTSNSQEYAFCLYIALTFSVSMFYKILRYVCIRRCIVQAVKHSLSQMIEALQQGNLYASVRMVLRWKAKNTRDTIIEIIAGLSTEISTKRISKTIMWFNLKKSYSYCYFSCQSEFESR